MLGFSLMIGNSSTHQVHWYPRESIVIHWDLMVLVRIYEDQWASKAGVKPFRSRQIANLLVHWTELALISLFTRPPRQIYYKPEPSLVSIDIVATYLPPET